ncbi:MAG: 4-alpha-glucanotransferase [Thermoanaerobaculia bacterium]|nr:4-alpha-glucanotransferase [Thermoanaerobaculia bacterium]
MNAHRPWTVPLDHRFSGILLHPTSLPGRGLLGELGPETGEFVRWLAETRQQIWQMLPITAAGRGGSPYDSRSAFAGEPALVSLEPSIAGGSRLSAPAPRGEEHLLDTVRSRKLRTLRSVWESFRRKPDPAVVRAREMLREDPDHRSWLEDWALYSAVKERYGGTPWWRWDRELRRAEPDTLRDARRELSAEIEFHVFVQALFQVQWSSLRDRARAVGVRLLGDLPIYVGPDSADVWLRRELFEVGPDGEMEARGGVPPDAFAADGQDWGAPLFRWDRHRSDDFAWWRRRLRLALQRFDRVRIDHFRGLVAYWRIPGDAETARDGEWVTAPGEELFRSLHRKLGPLRLVAENLGVITDEVEALRHRIGAPGMRVLQFAFDELDSPHLPHRHRRNEVVFTGTHDNPPTAAWYRSLDVERRRRLRAYLGKLGKRPHRLLVRAALTSVANLSVLPLQDVLGLGAEARMNVPGRAVGNWEWRLSELPPPRTISRWLRDLTEVTGRAEGDPEL